MATVLERAAHLVNRVFSLYICNFISHFGCEGRTLVHLAPLIGHRLPFTHKKILKHCLVCVC